MQLSRPIGRGVEGLRPQRRPRPPRPRWALPWEAQLQSTSETWMIMMIGMCWKATESTVTISTSSSWTSKHTVEQLRKGKWNWMFCHNVHIQKKTWKTSSKIWSSLFMFFGHCGGTSYNPLEFVEAAAWLKTVKRLGNSARILFCFFRPQSLGSEVKSVPNRRKMVRIEGKLKATCDTQKGTRQDHDGTPIRNVSRLKAGIGWILWIWWDLRFPHPGSGVTNCSTPRSAIYEVRPWGQGHECFYDTASSNYKQQLSQAKFLWSIVPCCFCVLQQL